ncbi:MAG: class I SAM-dependent methyltransferase [Planctomycetaceae bacterium]|nr:class I SAM-dependent methyltransferase [Planctomycetaceae bacterium]
MTRAPSELFEHHLPNLLADLEQLSRDVGPQAEPVVDRHLSAVTQRLESTLAACSHLEIALDEDRPALRAAQERFRAAIQPWFDQSWFMRHALAKPRGYAGDYQMLTAVYNRKPLSLGVGGYLDRYFLQTELGTSVPIRLAMAREFLTQEALQRGEMTVLNIASGPGREYQNGWSLPDECRVNVFCVDQDDAALDHIRQTVVPTLPHTMELECVKYNALKMGNSEANREVFGRPDVVYSIGLCDYIPDRLMIRLLRGWRETAAEGGVVYVAFKDCLKYDKSKYQWLVDWYFYQRTTEECQALFDRAGYDMDSLEVTRDATGSIINFISRMPEWTTVRLDGSQCAQPREIIANVPTGPSSELLVP